MLEEIKKRLVDMNIERAKMAAYTHQEMSEMIILKEDLDWLFESIENLQTEALYWKTKYNIRNTPIKDW